MKYTSLKSLRMGLAAAVCCLALTGCDQEKFLNPPTGMTQSEIRINQGQHSLDLDAKKVTGADIAEVAEHYQDKGTGEVVVRVTYDRGGDDRRAEIALSQVSRIQKMFRDEGIDARVVIMPVDEAHGRALVSYKVLEALPPEGCGLMPGMHGAAGLSHVDQYEMGCDTKLYMSKQIARPKDLLGNDTEEGFDAQRESVLYENMYRSGQPMQGVSGESASGTAD